MVAQQLLSSPTFHRGVEKVHKAVRKLRHGPDLEDMGGTKIESRYPSMLLHARSRALKMMQEMMVARNSWTIIWKSSRVNFVAGEDPSNDMISPLDA